MQALETVVITNTEEKDELLIFTVTTDSTSFRTYQSIAKTVRSASVPLNPIYPDLIPSPLNRSCLPR